MLSPHPYSGQHFGVFPLEYIQDVGVCRKKKAYQNIPTYVTTIPQCHGRTDRQMICSDNTALCVASRDRNASRNSCLQWLHGELYMFLMSWKQASSSCCMTVHRASLSASFTEHTNTHTHTLSSTTSHSTRPCLMLGSFDNAPLD